MEDWKQSDAKLPTYMKLLSVYIIPEGVPDEWLKKLIHQTMSKMLNNVSTPRYEFWAGLHLYLNKKYGNIGLSGEDNETTKLGKSLAQFSKTNNQMIDGYFRINSNKVIRVFKQSNYQQIAILETYKSEEPFSDTVYTNYEGASIQQQDKLIGLIRHIGDKTLSPLKESIDQFNELDNSNLKRRLAGIIGDV